MHTEFSFSNKTASLLIKKQRCIFNVCAHLQLLRSLVCNLMSLGWSKTCKALGSSKLRSLRNHIYVLLCGTCFCTSQVTVFLLIFILCTRVRLLSFLFFIGFLLQFLIFFKGQITPTFLRCHEMTFPSPNISRNDTPSLRFE